VAGNNQKRFVGQQPPNLNWMGGSPKTHINILGFHANETKPPFKHGFVREELLQDPNGYYT